MGIVFLDATQKVVHKPDDEEIHWRASAYALVRNDAGEVLMVKPSWHDKWELPGGGVEVEETLSQAIVRECMEETGYRVTITSVTPIHVGEQFFKGVRVDKFFHSIYVVYAGELIDSYQDVSAMNPDGFEEIKEVGWVSPDDIDEKNCHPIHLPVLHMLRNK